MRTAFRASPGAFRICSGLPIRGVQYAVKPGDDAVRVFPLDPHCQHSAIGMGIRTGIAKLETEDTASNYTFIIPHCGPSVKASQLFMYSWRNWAVDAALMT